MTSENECDLLFNNATGNIANILELNRLKVRDYIPVLLYISIGIVIGTTGNAAVIYFPVAYRLSAGTKTLRLIVAVSLLAAVWAMEVGRLHIGVTIIVVVDGKACTVRFALGENDVVVVSGGAAAASAGGSCDLVVGK
ncbi:Hypothetical predicted protein [Octopus vulgaris]|uniref:Uncharacterized protein n=1 Tax=Octopus vulgaris TaxID=6645 RepID=A0AA36BEP5_OCTVU|nr:Hypothetical predicted protein [Octopus vulgaris]